MHFKVYYGLETHVHTEKQRRKRSKCIMMFKIINDLINIPANHFTVKIKVFVKHLLGCYSCHLHQAPLRVFCYTHKILQLHPWGVEDILKENGNGVFSLLYSQSHFYQTISNIICIIDTKNIQETWIYGINTYIQYHQLFLPLMVFSLYL